MDIGIGDKLGFDTIEAVKRLACQSCRAPGIYFRRLDNSELNTLSPRARAEYVWRLENWPNVFVTGDLVDQPIDDTCPCCGTGRPAPIDQGIIWKKDAA